MSDIIYLPSFPVLVKPNKGERCNGCGWCCHEEVCLIGRHYYGEEQSSPCPAIVYENGRVKCGVVMWEQAIGRENDKDSLTKALGIGRGCDADDPGKYEK